MRDKATAFETDKTMFDYVKGHTKIELTDINTGETKVIEKDNTFQSAVLAQYMRSMGAYNNNPYANGTWAGQSIWRNLVGGLLLFKDAIDLSNGDVEYMPAGNVMTGNGAYGVTNSGTPVELGSYNSVESVTSGPDSLTFVYDFTTSQAVGDIACVCLTSEIGGYIGYGNPSGTAASTKKAFTANQSSASLSNDFDNVHRGVIYKNNRYAFTVDLVNAKLGVTKKPTEIDKGSIFDNIAETATEVSITGTATTSGAYYGATYAGSGKAVIWLYNSGYQTVANGATYSIILFDLETETATIKNIVNNTGDSLYISQNAPYSFAAIGAAGDYLLLQSTASPYKVYAINMDTSVATEVASGVNVTASLPTKDAHGWLTSDLLRISENSECIYDFVNGTSLPTNGTGRNLIYHDFMDAMSNSAQIFKNPLYLATVNNLVSPVNKTAAQTMKVTYTLTKA